MNRALLAALAALCVSACVSHPQSLPVAVSVCDAVQSGSGFTIVATIENKSTKPISRLDLTTAFYQNFRYSNFTASARLKSELDPGQKREIEFDVANASKAQFSGQAMRCYVTHIGYLDGTSADAPVSQ